MQLALTFRAATADDLPDIVAMLADDSLGAQRERLDEPLAHAYSTAFEAIVADPNNELIVAALEGRVVGVLQLTFIPGLSHQGSWRAIVESVRVRSPLRGRGIGRMLLDHAISQARERACRIVQLTSNKSRADAVRFYESLGFRATHEGMKLDLPQLGSG